MDSWLELFANTNFRRSSDTAHDLKTPLNVAVLNLELLRMRVAKLAGGEVDEKVLTYAKSIESELRRMARIFDTFFLLCVPPKSEGEPHLVDIAALAGDGNGPAWVRAHESRIREALRLFADGAARVLRDGSTTTARSRDRFEVAVSGTPAADDFEITKIFKFYYTDAAGNPDLSLAAARLIAETYGGELNATEERGNVVVRLSFPLGEP